MIRGIRGWALVLFVIVLMTGTVSALSQWARESSATVLAAEMREELGLLREGLDACLEEQGRIEDDFEAVTRRTERLREELNRLENLDPRGVPQERYAVYLELVDEYNESIPEWEEGAERLRLQSASCREMIEVHNVQADSLRRFLVGEGLLDEGGD